MNFKTKTSLTLSAAALLILSACSDNSDKSSSPSEEEAAVSDTTTVSDNPNPALEDTTKTQTDTTSTPVDTTNTPADTTANTGSKVVMPEEAAEITAAITIEEEKGKGILVSNERCEWL